MYEICYINKLALPALPCLALPITGGSAASAATSGDISVATTVSRVSVVVYAAQIHHKAIPIVGSTTDRGISSGTGGLK